MSNEEGMTFETDKDGNVISDSGTSITLYIWPKMFIGYTYGIDVENADEMNQINVDNKGQYIPDKNVDPENQKKLEEILEKNKEEIDNLFDLADKMWNIR